MNKNNSKNGVAFLGGMVFLVPVQTFYARKYFKNFTGSYLENLKYFFTHVTDFSGYDGAFTPGHLWFILFLFVISIAALFFFHVLPYGKAERLVGRIQNMKWLVGLCLIGNVVSAILYYNVSYYGDLWVNYIGWNTILVLLALGRRFLDKQTRATAYLNQASYPIYILHQSILVTLAYYVVQMGENLMLQVLLICFGSFVLTILAYHLVKMAPMVRKKYM